MVTTLIHMIILLFKKKRRIGISDNVISDTRIVSVYHN